MQLFALVALHGILGYSVAWSLDLGTLFKFGLPVLFLLGNMLVTPFVGDRAYRIDWNPSEPPLDEDIQSFLLEVFQMHGKAPPTDLAALIGRPNALPVSLGVVEQSAPHILITRAPSGGAGLVVSTGFSQRLSPMQQKAALAHELYYLLEPRRSFFSNALMMLPTILFTAYRFVDADPNGNFFQRWAGQLLYGGYRLSLAASAWTLRSRVLRADAFSAEMSGDPVALAEAILLMTYGLGTEDGPAKMSSPLDVADADHAHGLADEAQALGDTSPAGLSRALAWERSNLAARLFELFAHHPLPSRRLDALARAASALGRDFPLDHDAPRLGFRYWGLFCELLSRAAPWVGGYLGYIYCSEYDWPSNIPFFILFGATSGLTLGSIIWYRPFSPYRPTTARGLLEDLDVSDSHPVCAQLEGKIVGRDQAGYAFGADLRFRDETGSLTLQYKQPVPLLDSAFAYYEADQLQNRPIRVEGWFRRNPEPYLEVRRITSLDDGRVFGCYRFLWQWVMIGGAAWVTKWVRENW